MNIGQRVREAREELGMQRTVLARRIGVAENTVYRIETGRRTPSVELLEKIAGALRTEPAELLREPAPAGKGEASPEQDRPKVPSVPYTQMPADEFEELRASAIASEVDGAQLREALDREHSALVEASKFLAAEQFADELRALRREARKRWLVVTFDRAEATIAEDLEHDPEAVERPDIRTLPLEEAYEEIQSVLARV